MRIDYRHHKKIRMLREREWSWRQIAVHFGSSPDTVRAAVDPEHKEKLARMRGNYSETKRAYDKNRGANRYKLGHSPHRMGADMPSALFKVPDDVMAERERVVAAPQTMGQMLLGDPAPGRSALDKRKPHVVVSND